MKKTLVTLAILGAAMISTSAYAGGSPGSLNEVATPLCLPNWAITGAILPIGTTNVKCPSSQNG